MQQIQEKMDHKLEKNKERNNFTKLKDKGAKLML